MPNQILTYFDDNMESGEFYLIEANLDNASNVRNIKTITEPLAKATEDIISINAKNESQDIEINKLGDYFEDYREIILDNQARINNLELAEVQKIIGFLDRASITGRFENATHVEIQYARRSVSSVFVVEVLEDTPTRKRYKNTSVDWEILEELIDGNWIKKVIIQSNSPITGYAVIL